MKLFVLLLVVLGVLTGPFGQCQVERTSLSVAKSRLDRGKSSNSGLTLNFRCAAYE